MTKHEKHIKQVYKNGIFLSIRKQTDLPSQVSQSLSNQKKKLAKVRIRYTHKQLDWGGKAYISVYLKEEEDVTSKKIVKNNKERIKDERRRKKKLLQTKGTRNNPVNLTATVQNQVAYYI